MDTRNNMVIIDGKIRTSEIISCVYNENLEKWSIKFLGGEKYYSYGDSKVEHLMNPKILDPNMYQIKKEEQELFHVTAIYEFKGRKNLYWHICFRDGSERDYSREELHIFESILNQNHSKNVFEYIKQIAKLSDIRNEETGEKLLAKMFEKLFFIRREVALATYLDPSLLQTKKSNHSYVPIFPFGCNNSQYDAVKNAMENQISIIQGPPGTGKTQTILNIIANILMQGKTVQIVSNNNSATENVYEKLSSSKYCLGFIAATLGNSKNKRNFIQHQEIYYPDFASWKIEENPNELQKRISEQSIQLKNIFNRQNELASLKQELSQLVVELKYFEEYVVESDVKMEDIKFKKNLHSKSWMSLYQECQMILERS